jgi:hypothetical protein
MDTLKDKDKEKDKDKDLQEGCGEEAGRKDRPTMDELVAYCRERGGKVDPQAWMDHYTANGWRVGKNPMRDWRAAVRQWERNEFRNGNGNGKPVTFAQQRQQNTVDLLQRLKAQDEAGVAGFLGGSNGQSK